MKNLLLVSCLLFLCSGLTGCLGSAIHYTEQKNRENFYGKKIAYEGYVRTNQYLGALKAERKNNQQYSPQQ